jgi:chemotaxis protein methyltransferase CheR
MAPGDDAAAELQALLAHHTGFALDGERGQRARAAIRESMKHAGLSDDHVYLALVRADPRVLDDLVSKILVGETYFVREPQHWVLVRDTVLAEIMERCGPSHVVRCWSAGCASGEEAYSLAIVLEQAGMSGRASVVGTDISRTALARARAATYTAWSLRAASDEYCERWFHRCGNDYVVTAAVRDCVAFQYLNLAADAYPSMISGIGAQDLILCRNVLLYFDRETTARVMKQLFASLAPGGWLICGSSDPSPVEHAAFQAVMYPEGIAYRRPLSADPLETSCSSTAGPAPITGALDSATPARDVADTRTAAATARHQLDPERYYARAMALVDLGRLDDAVAELRRVLYLDRTLAVAHFALGVLLERAGEASKARRSYRNAAGAVADRPPDEPARLGNGESNRTVATAARRRAERLTAASVPDPGPDRART